MLVLTRMIGQKLLIGDDIEVCVVEIKGNQVRLGVAAPKHVRIMRPDAVLQHPKPAVEV